MKKSKIIVGAAIAAMAIFFAGCSNLFEEFLTEDGTAKTGNDSLTSRTSDALPVDDESTNTILDAGLVVIKSTRPKYNQITFDPSQKDYVVGVVNSSDPTPTNGTKVCLGINDNPITLKCFPEDKNATVTWSAVQSATCSMQKTLIDITPKAVEITEASGDRIVTSKIPYGKTVVTAKVTADDTQYSTTYTVTFIRFFEAKSALEITGDEDYDTYTINTDDLPDGVRIDKVVRSTKYGKVNENDYKILLTGGKSTITITYKDAENKVYTQSITVTTPEDGDTSLQSFDYSPSASFANGVKETESETLKSDMGVLYTDLGTEPNGTFAYTVSADNNVDVTKMSFLAVPTHKYTTVAYYVGDTCPVADSNDWSTTYTKAQELAAKDGGTYAPEATDITLNNENSSSTTTLWIKTTSKAYKHSLENDAVAESDVTFHKAVVTKAGKGNTNLTALYVKAEYQNDLSSKAKLINLTTTSDVAYIVDSSTQYQFVTTYADSMTFYFRTLDKSDTDAPKTITYTAINTKYVGSENALFTGYAATETDVTTETIDGIEYYKFTIGTKDGETDSNSDLPDGKTTVKIFVNGTTASTIEFTKPDINNTNLGSLGYAGAEGVGDNNFYIYIDNTVEQVVLNSTTKQQDAEIESVASYIEGADGSTVTETSVTTDKTQDLTKKNKLDNHNRWNRRRCIRSRNHKSYANNFKQRYKFYLLRLHHKS